VACTYFSIISEENSCKKHRIVICDSDITISN